MMSQTIDGITQLLSAGQATTPCEERRRRKRGTIPPCFSVGLPICSGGGGGIIKILTKGGQSTGSYNPGFVIGSNGPLFNRPPGSLMHKRRRWWRWKHRGSNERWNSNEGEQDWQQREPSGGDEYPEQDDDCVD
jgi:hypothetical protein